MCLLLLSHGLDPERPLLVAANRDEFHARPTVPAAFWEDSPDVLAGRDLTAGGTWLGVTRSGRFAALTNFRDPAGHDPRAKSRGLLVAGFLRGTATPEAYLRSVASSGVRYNPFNLVAGGPGDLWFYESQTGRMKRLGTGVFGLSNALLDTPWPKVERSKEALRRLLSREGAGPGAAELLALLADRTRAEDELLPDTGVGLAWERLLSSPFIVSPEYGTRSSAALLFGGPGETVFAERTFAPDGSVASEAAFTL